MKLPPPHAADDGWAATRQRAWRDSHNPQVATTTGHKRQGAAPSHTPTATTTWVAAGQGLAPAMPPTATLIWVRRPLGSGLPIKGAELSIPPGSWAERAAPTV